MSPVPKVIITSESLAIAASPDMYCYAQVPNISAQNQQWQLIYYPEKDAVALLIDINNTTFALSAPSGEEYPKLRPFIWDDSYLWRVPPLGGNLGIPTVRGPSHCLTWEGTKWAPGTKLQYWQWHDIGNQKWKVTR